MGREASVTEDQILNECHQLEMQSQKVTGRAVREALGRGSLSTIGPVVRKYKTSKSRRSMVVDDIVDPEINQVISNHIATRITAATAEMTADLADLQSEYDDLRADHERKCEKIEAAEANQASLQSEYAALTGCATQMENEINRLEKEVVEQRNQAEAARLETVESRLKLEALPGYESEIENLRSLLDSVRDKAASDLAQAIRESATSHEAASVAAVKLRSEMTIREAISKTLAEVTQQRDDAIVKARSAVELTARLRGQLLERKSVKKAKVSNVA